MAIIKSNHMNHNTKYIFFTKIVTFLILSWIYQCTKHENVLSKSLENGNNVNISLDMRIHRLLTKHVYEPEMQNRGLKYNVSHNRDNYKLEKGTRNNITYVQLKQSRSNDLYAYLKSYKNRYSKKSGLKKLDCYFENALFNKVDCIEKISESLQNDKKLFIKKIHNICGIRLILLFLLPILGVIFPITIYGLYAGGKYCTYHDGDTTGYIILTAESKSEQYPLHGYRIASISTEAYLSLKYLNYIFLC
ncbi:Plasmodium exported protein, unknown function [Plasmodium vivax]|uniref:Fam-l protein n=1 Tax=Plasmodium vivax TaxID=5855 RepID=A0A565A5Y8_PLAVI|nr:Plasmodium exported protein, unknown function [Plasmodium vivax]